MRGRFLAVAASVTLAAQAAAQPYAGGGGGVLVQTQADAFGGYFCCEAGGTVPALWGEAGGRVSDSLALGGEVTAMRAFTIDVSAPRFEQQTRHRDTFFAGLLAWHPRGRRAGVSLAFGGGAARSRTRREFRLIDFTHVPPRPSEPPGVIEANRTVPFLTAGLDVPVALGPTVRLVPRLRLFYVSRDEEARAQDGLGHWTILVGGGLRFGR
jgi:hypothetical protein